MCRLLFLFYSVACATTLVRTPIWKDDIHIFPKDFYDSHAENPELRLAATLFITETDPHIRITVEDTETLPGDVYEYEYNGVPTESATNNELYQRTSKDVRYMPYNARNIWPMIIRSGLDQNVFYENAKSPSRSFHEAYVQEEDMLFPFRYQWKETRITPSSTHHKEIQTPSRIFNENFHIFTQTPKVHSWPNTYTLTRTQWSIIINTPSRTYLRNIHTPSHPYWKPMFYPSRYNWRELNTPTRTQWAETHSFRRTLWETLQSTSPFPWHKVQILSSFPWNVAITPSRFLWKDALNTTHYTWERVPIPYRTVWELSTQTQFSSNYLREQIERPVRTTLKKYKVLRIHWKKVQTPSITYKKELQTPIRSHWQGEYLYPHLIKDDDKQKGFIPFRTSLKDSYIHSRFHMHRPSRTPLETAYVPFRTQTQKAYNAIRMLWEEVDTRSGTPWQEIYSPTPNPWQDKYTPVRTPWQEANFLTHTPWQVLYPTRIPWQEINFPTRTQWQVYSITRTLWKDIYFPTPSPWQDEYAPTRVSWREVVAPTLYLWQNKYSLTHTPWKEVNYPTQTQWKEVYSPTHTSWQKPTQLLWGEAVTGTRFPWKSIHAPTRTSWQKDIPSKAHWQDAFLPYFITSSVVRTPKTRSLLNTKNAIRTFSTRPWHESEWSRGPTGPDNIYYNFYNDYFFPEHVGRMNTYTGTSPVQCIFNMWNEHMINHGDHIANIEVEKEFYDSNFLEYLIDRMQRYGTWSAYVKANPCFTTLRKYYGTTKILALFGTMHPPILVEGRARREVNMFRKDYVVLTEKSPRTQNRVFKNWLLGITPSYGATTEFRYYKTIQYRAQPTKRSTTNIKVHNSKCYVCGLNKKGIPDDECFRVFGKKHNFRVNDRFNYMEHCPNTQIIPGCFWRFLDVGSIYDERGCREWPPRPGQSFGSDRFVRLEKLLRYKKNACVTSPVAIMTPFSEKVYLYARYTVCVCTPDYCNNRGQILSSDIVILFLAVVKMNHCY